MNKQEKAMMEDLLNELRKANLHIPSKLWDFIWNETDFRTNKTLKVARYVEYIDEWKGKLVKRVFAFKSYSKKRAYDDIMIVEVFRKLEGQSGCLLASIWHDMAGHHVEFNANYQDKYFWRNKTEYTFWNCWCMYDQQEIIDRYDLKYCQWFNENNRSYSNFFDYICAYRAEPKIELLVKAGLSQYVHCYKKLNLKEKSLDKIFRVNNYWVPFLKELSYSDIMLIKNKKLGIRTYDELVFVRENIHLISAAYHGNIFKHRCKKMYQYIAQHKEQLREYNDYLGFCETLGYDLTSHEMLYPKDIHKKHDQYMKHVEIKKDEETREKFQKVYLNNLKYVYSNSNLVIIPCETLSQLEYESEKLEHCVKTYADRYMNGETNLFFIRHIDDVTEPYATLELRGKKVIQCRGYKNNVNVPLDESVKVFVNGWCKKNQLQTCFN